MRKITYLHIHVHAHLFGHGCDDHVFDGMLYPHRDVRDHQFGREDEF